VPIQIADDMAIPLRCVTDQGKRRKANFPLVLDKGKVIAKNPEEREVFALMTMDDTKFEVTTFPSLSDPSPPNKPITNSYNATGLLGHEI